MATENLNSVELIEFTRPCGNANNLYIKKISEYLNEEEAQCKLFKIFSKFGLVYEIQVLDSRENVTDKQPSMYYNDSRGTLYAFVKYYSVKAAARALKETNNKYLIGGQYLKVQYANRKKSLEKPTPLFMSKCVELANYYLGFNGWSTSITKIEKVDHATDVSLSEDNKKAMFRCVVKLEIKSQECYCEGIGYGGDKTLFDKEKDPLKKLELTAIAKKVAHRHAFQNTFQRVIIILLDNGKVAVEINRSEIPKNKLMTMSEEGIVQVNYRDDVEFSDEAIDDEILEALNAITITTVIF